MLRFEIQSPDGSKQVRRLPERDVTIGRDPANDIPIAESNVSRFQVAIVLRDSGEYVLRDLGSLNGTLVNGTETFRHVLQPGDEISVGPCVLTFVGASDSEEAEAARPSLPVKPRPKKGAETLSVTRTEPDPRQASAPAVGPESGRADTDADRLTKILESVREIAQLPDVKDIIDRVLEAALSCLGCDTGFVLLREGDRLDCAAVRPQSLADGPLSATNASAAYEALDTRAAVVGVGKGAEARDTLCIPLVVGEAATGVIGVEGKFREQSPIDGLDVAEAICGLCAAHIENARELSRLKRQCTKLHEALRANRRLVGSSPVLQEVYARLNQAAQYGYPVLITGETGTGKEVVARAIHQLSERHDRRFVACNCAAIPESLLESEMFGYAPHSGIANADPNGRPGKFEMAHEGTIFLDEIGDFSANTQAKLLRILEDCVVERIGSNEPMQIDVQVVAATNRDVQAMIADGAFREDLYHRINCLQITLPPLRDRESDILLLAAYFLEQDVPPPLNENLRITKETARLLSSYHWPGNIRQLRNAIRAAATRATTNRLDPEHFDLEDARQLGASLPIKTLRQMEKEHIEYVLRAVDGNKRDAARMLDISPQTLYNKIKEYGIQPDRSTQQA